MTIDNPIYQFPARLMKGSSSDEMMQRAITDMAFDPTAFEDLKPFFFPAEISSSRMDAYFTKMALSSLKNYAAEAKGGISLQDSHNSRRLGLGRSFSAKLDKVGEDDRVVAEFYTVHGIKFNDATYQTSDDFINAIRTGIAHDISIGFYGGEYICSLCNVDMWDWEAGCRHWPGDKVDIKDPDTGKVLRTETVYASIVNAHLSEVSVVYNGATPGAMILRAERAIKEGQLSRDQVCLLENRYRFKLPEARHVVATGEIKTEKEESDMSTENKERQTPPGSEDPNKTPSSEPDTRDVVIADIRKALADAGFTGDNMLESLRTALGEVTTLRTKVKDLEAKTTTEGDAELRKLADDGRAYRSDLIKQAIEEGVRANGADFKQEEYKGILESSTLDVIKRMRDDWKTLADKNLPGGRKTVEGEEPQPKPAANNNVPDAAYAS